SIERLAQPRFTLFHGDQLELRADQVCARGQQEHVRHLGGQDGRARIRLAEQGVIDGGPIALIARDPHPAGGVALRIEVDEKRAKAGEELKGYKGKEKVKADKSIDQVEAADYDALLIPGGQSPDHLRVDKRMVDFVKQFDQSGKLIAAVCHGPQLLMAAHLTRGRTLTAWQTIQDDLQQVGATVKDEPVVNDRNWITSR